MLDVLIVGGGPAGLSAALVLARCGRKIIVVDEGRRRNHAAREMHGYLTRDGIAPSDFDHLARQDLRRYGVDIRHQDRVDHLAKAPDGTFTARLASGSALTARKALLATGVRDILPAITGLDQFYGASIHHCPYCDAWEHRGQRLAAYGKGPAALGLALALRTWSDTVTACTDGELLTDADLARAARNAITIRPERVSQLLGPGDQLQRIRFDHGDDLECDALFFNTGQVQRSDLATRLGCTFKEDGGVHTDKHQCTGVAGLYLAGDADKDVQFVINAAAEGATAAVAINRELQDEDRGESRKPST